MKKVEVEQLKEYIIELKKITDMQEYLVSTPANQLYNKILPVLDKELDKLNKTNNDVDCPAVLLLKRKDNKQSLTELINTELHKLVLNDYRILDFDIKQIEGEDTIIIKYTN